MPFTFSITVKRGFMLAKRPGIHLSLHFCRILSATSLVGSGRPEQPTPSFSDRDAGRLAWLAYLNLSSDFQRFRLLGDLQYMIVLFSFLSFFLSLELRFNISISYISKHRAFMRFLELLVC